MEEYNEPKVEPSVQSTEPKVEVIQEEPKPKVRIKKTVIWQGVSLVFLIALIASIMTGGFRSSDSPTGAVVADGELKAILISDARCTECNVANLKTQLAQTFPNLVIEEMDYADAKDIYSEAGLTALPAVLFGDELTQDANYAQVEKFVEEKGEYLSIKVGAAFDPEAEICDNGKDDTGNGKVDCEDDTCSGVWKCMEKMDVPKVEAFVMSHCPFGTQIEKGLLPVMELLSDKADIEIKFVNYAMHGEKEVIEQTNQYCIQKEQNDKFIDYLTCFLEAGEGDKCLESEGIDMDKLKDCYDAADEEFAITENLEDESKWSGGRFPLYLIHDEECKKYGVRGSPSLVINGVVAQSGRDPASILNAVCTGFKEKPAECDEELSSDNPSSGFGFGTQPAANAAAGCGV